MNLANTLGIMSNSTDEFFLQHYIYGPQSVLKQPQFDQKEFTKRLRKIGFFKLFKEHLVAENPIQAYFVISDAKELVKEGSHEFYERRIERVDGQFEME